MILALTNTVGWIIRFVFGALAALTLLFSLWVGYEAFVQSQNIQAGEWESATGQFAPSAVSRWWRTRNDLNEQFNTSQLTSQRALQLRTFVSYDALFDADEARPDPAFADVYATARAPRVLGSFCEELLVSLARRCQLVDFESKVNEDDQVDVRARFLFVPDAAPGELPKLAQGEIRNFRIHLTRSDRIPDTRDMRLQALAGAEQLCDALRARLQNCVVSRVYFSPDTQRGSDGPLLDAQIVLAAYTDLSEADQQEVLVGLREQAKSILP